MKQLLLLFTILFLLSCNKEDNETIIYCFDPYTEQSYFAGTCKEFKKNCEDDDLSESYRATYCSCYEWYCD